MGIHKINNQVNECGILCTKTDGVTLEKSKKWTCVKISYGPLYNGIFQFFPRKKTTISNTDNRRLMTLVNRASTVLPIGAPSKGAKFCHTSNKLLVGWSPCPIVAVF